MFTKEKIQKYQKGILIGANQITVKNEKSVEYEIIASRNIFSLQNLLIQNICQGNKAVIYISPNVNRIYGIGIRQYFETHFSKDFFHIEVIPTTELNKSLENVARICSVAREQHLDRKGIMIAIGGGVLNDIVGFAASIYRRGIRYIRVCTTLVGQIDVAVGIKVGANFQDSKNFIGAFYPPMASINDLTFLSTLPQREIRCGIAETIKMAIVSDHELFSLVENHWQKLFQKDFDDPHVTSILAKTKLRMIEELYDNLYETKLERIVDFGHSFSSRIESLSNYSIQHGEAVAMDMALSSKIAQMLTKISDKDYFCIVRLISNVGLKLFDEKYCEAEELWYALYEMHLHRGGKINLVIPSKIGEAIFIKDIKDISVEFIQEAVSSLKRDAKSLES